MFEPVVTVEQGLKPVLQFPSGFMFSVTLRYDKPPLFPQMLVYSTSTPTNKFDIIGAE